MIIEENKKIRREFAKRKKKTQRLQSAILSTNLFYVSVFTLLLMVYNTKHPPSTLSVSRPPPLPTKSPSSMATMNSPQQNIPAYVAAPHPSRSRA